MNKRNAIAAAILSVWASSSFATSEAEVGCAVIDFIDDAMVQFSGVLTRDDIIDVIYFDLHL